MMNLTWVIAFPFIGFLINGLYQISVSERGGRSNPYLSGAIATGMMFLSFLVSVLLFQNSSDTFVDFGTWFNIGDVPVQLGLRFDFLSSVFTLIITGVGTLIHLFSISYLSNDETPARYFSYLNLFCFMMLNLVLAASVPHLFLGWEGVGLASYLLIGYWFKDAEKVQAGNKAFIMNRIGDLGLVLAMGILYKHAGTFDLIQAANVEFLPSVGFALGLLLFLGCTGKSAQIPLWTWLPDAMAGPTPVSALIHAATMVTSGLYLLGRFEPLIAAQVPLQQIIALTGALTAMVAALIACGQSDIKKILAYSTISQLGFMFIGFGALAGSAGIFHVMTHAFFKALLFLGAGAVIHALHEEQNIFKMGGLAKKIPLVFGVFVVGWAAILGLPPFSGYFSKDAILIAAYESTNLSPTVFYIGVFSAFLTAYYMTRLLVVTFLSPSRMKSSVENEIHGPDLLMSAPLVILAVFSLVGGMKGAPVQFKNEAQFGHPMGVIMALVTLSLVGALIAYFRFKDTRDEEPSLPALKSGLGWDQFYKFVFARGFEKAAGVAQVMIEEGVVQRLQRWVSSVVDLVGSLMKAFQVGSLQVYLMYMFVGIIVVWAFLSRGALSP